MNLFDRLDAWLERQGKRAARRRDRRLWDRSKQPCRVCGGVAEFRLSDSYGERWTCPRHYRRVRQGAVT